ncbi:rhamnan synthesis F family protein [Yersinia enterocolitica]|nr:hypothetical protein [Yersinia enterocolitica]
MNKTNRVCIFAHYDKDNIIDPYVIYYLKKLKEANIDVVFVSVSNILNTELIKPYTINIINRDNIGYDFMSWQVGLASINDIQQYDELIFCNDSCYGPLYPLDHILNKFTDDGNTDFWGITDNIQLGYHIQSYFIAFKSNVFNSDVFKEFINSISVEKSKEDIVYKYEVGLTKKLHSRGFKSSVLVSYKEILSTIDPKKIYLDKFNRICTLLYKSLKEPSGAYNRIVIFFMTIRKYTKKLKEFSVKENSNITFVAWREILINGSPFIKVMLLRDNPTGLKNLSSYESIINELSEYDISLIDKHLKRVNNID